MADPRAEILDWAEQGRIAPGKLRAALEAAGALPSAADWRRFLDRLLLWMGAVMLACSAIFFFAFNWAEMGRLAKIGLVEAAIVGALALLWKLGLERAAGKATLFAAALLAGGLFALIGQIYQTGADTWELFAVWAAAILPWTLAGRLPALWVLWLALLNLAGALYYQTFGILFGMLFAPERLLWMLFGLNTAALILWEACAAGGGRLAARALVGPRGRHRERRARHLARARRHLRLAEVQPLGPAAVARLDGRGVRRVPAPAQGCLRARGRRALGDRRDHELLRETDAHARSRLLPLHRPGDHRPVGGGRLVAEDRRQRA
jgi:hypothetical protein